MQSAIDEIRQLINDAGPLVTGLVVLVISGLVGFVVQVVLHFLARRAAKRTDNVLDDKLIARLKWPTRLLMPALAMRWALPALGEDHALRVVVVHPLSLLLIASITWMAIACVLAIEQWLIDKHDVGVSDNLRARKIHTQARVLGRALAIIIGIVGLGAAAMTFPEVRQVGTSLLASAGIAGLVVGIAARPLISNLIAGIMIAVTEPIRIDDVVIVEGEWGRIERFTPTYVVVKIWDERRLVVPLSYFLEQPFQNWTKESADILGTVFLWTDYTVPFDELREKLKEVVEASEQWDGRVCNLQVTDANSDGVQVRFLMSASDASKAWTLRCHVREAMIAHLQEKHPKALPRVRAEVRLTDVTTGSDSNGAD